MKFNLRSMMILFNNHVLQPALRLLETLIAASAALIVLERFNQEGLSPLLEWLTVYPRIAAANLLILASLYALLRVWFRKPLLPACIFGLLVFTVGSVHYLKVLLKGEPLMPMDIHNFKEASMIAPNMNIQLDQGFWINLMFLAICIVMISAWQRFVLKPLPARRRMYAAPAAILAVFCIAGLGNAKVRSHFDVLDIRYNQSYNYQYNGFMVASLMNMSGAKVKTPEHYDQDYFRQVLQTTEFNTAPKTEQEVKPNIIVLQMEAYSDPRLLDPSLKYKPDPFAPLKPYRDSMQSFHTLASVLGGSTATTEFEFLTGFNMDHAPQGIMPFVQYMTKDRPSLVWDLKDLGYQTVGIHPNTGTFYSRDVAYPHLGFEQFITLEDFKDPQYVGYYVSDQSTKDKIIETYKNRIKEKPFFCFTVTIQNHGPYNLEGIDRPYGVKEGAVALSDTQNRELRNFGANLQDSSQMLADLIKYFSKQDEPVLILAYGDHQATWSWAKTLPASDDLQAAKYLTEGFFWANYPVDFEERPVIGSNYLAPYLLKYAGIPLPEYDQLLYRQAEQILGYNPFFVMKNDQTIALQPDDSVEAFALVQYDRMFGKNYLESLLQKRGQ
jgi:phosphoglycerol transferase MdoB-like AlkP superfamily enzyme